MEIEEIGPGDECEDGGVAIYTRIDGTNAARISGEVEWMTHTFAISEGTHTFRWAYAKDATVDEHRDTGWLDHIRVTYD